MPSFTATALFLCAFWAAAGPLLSPRLEERLEWLVLGAGAAALTVSWGWSLPVIADALSRAATLCGALVAGALAFSLAHARLKSLSQAVAARAGTRAAVAGVVALAGFSAPLVTGAVAVLLLVEALGALPLQEERRQEAAILGCCGIGLGSASSALGGPVPAVVAARLAHASYPVGRGYLFFLVGPWAVSGVLAAAAGAALLAGPRDAAARPLEEDPLSLWGLLVLAGRTFVFVCGLVLLGAGLLPLVEQRLIGLHPAVLYWVNAAAAVVDNATLAALEAGPALSQAQLRHILLSLSAAGGALVTGSAVNLVAARKLGIPARRWARVGLPAAGTLMLFGFLSLAAL